MRLAWLLAIVCAGRVLDGGLAYGQDTPAPQGSQPSAQPSRSANVIIVSIDTLRADRLGSYGYGRPTSPTIDSLAADLRLASDQWR